MPTDPITTVEIEELRRLEAAAPPGEWELWDSNSWRRIGIRGGGRTAIEPTIHLKDGMSDLHAKPETLRLAVAARNALPRLLDEIERLRAERDDLNGYVANLNKMLPGEGATAVKIDRLRAENEALRADAERWRKVNAALDSGAGVLIEPSNPWCVAYALDGPEWGNWSNLWVETIDDGLSQMVAAVKEKT